MAEVQPAQPPSASSPSANPPWVLLQERGCVMVDDDGNGSPYPPSPYFPSSTTDSQTRVSACTSTGVPFQVYLHIAEPPTELTVLCAKFPYGRSQTSATIIAAHLDSMLIKVCIAERRRRPMMVDLFVYNAGAAATDPPCPPSMSMLALPPCHLTFGNGWIPRLQAPIVPIGMSRDKAITHHAVGMLRHSKDDIVIAELGMVGEGGISPGPKTAELFMFRSGEWSIRRPKIIQYANHDFVGIFFIVDYRHRRQRHRPAESPRLQFLPLPTDPCYGRASNRNVCVTIGGTALRFVNIFPRCCCGGEGATGCHRSRHAYTINTWTLRVSDMEWVKDGVIHNTDLWGLDAYKNLPCLRPTYPVVSMDEPHIISFLVSYEDDYDIPWIIMVDMKSKTLRLVTQDHGGLFWARDSLIPSSLSYYLNPCPISCSSNVISTGQSHIERPLMAIVDEQARDHGANNNLTMQSCCQSAAEPAAQASEILAALQEIPGYGLDDNMLKAAYRTLSHGNGNRCRSLLSLPMNVRKDWLLKEIKASEA
ncbi:unnamed protein product [Urochloa decumbens]|uniref:DUF1618 domain-containing protein n=1 Tax=Urochloa decumbens TaxID=240449 RepID=A0ABC9B7Y0_9POAL